MRRFLWVAPILILLGLPPILAADDQDQPAAAPARPGDPIVMEQAAIDWLNDAEGASAFGRWLRAELEARGEHPEWLDMFADILQGSRLGPTEGWFRAAVAQTCFTWDSVRSKLDQDADSRISRTEFPGSDVDFQRLDRDGDSAITEPDLAWPDHALAPGPGASLYYRADANADGRVSPEEFSAVFQSLDRDGQGFLSQDDLRALFPPARPAAARSGSDSQRPDGPTRAVLVRGLFEQEIGSMQPGPRIGDLAPDFTLNPVNGTDGPYTLSNHLGHRPIVLVFGNITCGPFRSQAGNVEKLYHRYKDRADFAMVYVREAHPTDGWHMTVNDRYGVTLAQPRTLDERTSAARQCRQSLDFDMPFLVDTMDDSVGAAYSGMPSRLYVISSQGKVVYQSGRGPFGFKPAEMEQALIWQLSERETGPAKEVTRP